MKGVALDLTIEQESSRNKRMERHAMLVTSEEKRYSTAAHIQKSELPILPDLTLHTSTIVLKGLEGDVHRIQRLTRCPRINVGPRVE